MTLIKTSLLLLGLLASAAQAALPAIRSSEPGIDLKPLAVHWQLAGPFALRRIEIVIRNPHDRALETTVLLPLAANERLHGYALDVEGTLCDAVPVDRIKARTVFEETVRQQVDPAVAEQDGAANAYRIRVFPVPPRGERRLRIDVASLAERSACGWQHRLYLPLPAGDGVPASLSANSRPLGPAAGLPIQRDGGQYLAHWRPRQSGSTKTLCLPAPAGDAAFVSRLDDGLQMNWLEVPVSTRLAETRPALRTLEVVWDASLSQSGLNRDGELALLGRYLADRPVDIVLTILRQDVQQRRVQIRTPAELATLLAELQAERPDGATNLGGWQPAAAVDGVLMFSDVTGTLPAQKLPVPTTPVFVIGTRLGDPALAHWLTRAGGAVIDLSRLDTTQALRQLHQQPAAQLKLGPLDRHWHAASFTPEQGVLRACHIAPSPSALPALPVRHAGQREVRQHRAEPATESSLAAFWCATWWADTLTLQAGQQRTQLAMLGERFGVANRETSLLVLERDDDYVRHGILPPAADVALRARVQQIRAREETRQAEAWRSNRADIEYGWLARATWWGRTYPKDDPRPRWAEEKRQAQQREAARREAYATQSAAEQARAPRPAMVGAPPAPAPAGAAPGSPANAPATTIGMRLQAVPMNAPYSGELSSAPDSTTLYNHYFDLRTRFGDSPAFHFDVAQRLFELGDTARAWRVLSNLIELMPNDQASLRLVAYRLQEAGLHAQAIDLLRRVRELAPDEPQSFRDLALALPATPESCQEALDLLAHVVDTPWHRRFADVGLIALAEYHDLKTRCPAARNTAWPATMQQTLPVNLRVVLRWDLNDTDIDLHVTDPNDETAYYAHRNTYQGGAMSRDFTAGYGPEEFVLRDPKPGEYKVAINYYGSRLARLTRGAVINITLQTGFGTPAMQAQSVSMRLLEKSGRILVGGFTVTPAGELRLSDSP